MQVGDKDFTLVPTEELTDLLNYKREYFKICELFKIPVKQRAWHNVATNVIERIHTYLTSYVARKSLSERENGAAFRDPEPLEIQDPNPKLDHTG